MEENKIEIISNDELSKYTIDKVANDNPMLTKEQHQELKKDIEDRGQLNPVVIFNDKIVDGRNRFKAVKDLGLDLKVIIATSRDEAIKLATSYNDKRRHMSKSQYAIIAARKILATRVDKNKEALPKTQWRKIEEAEEIVEKKVSARMVKSAIKIANKNTKLADKVFNGDLDLREALEKYNEKHLTTSTDKKKDNNIEELRSTYSKEVSQSYETYVKDIKKYTRQALARKLVELEQKLNNK